MLTYLYETSGGLVGRYRGFQLGSGSGSNSDLEQAYAFTSGGRFDTLATKRASNAVTRSFQYGYLPNSHLPSSISVPGHPFSVARTYAAHRDLVASVDSRWSSTSQTRFDYTYTAIMQRQTAKQSGQAFADYYPSSSYTSVYNVYAYNDRGELQTAALYRGDTPSASPAATDELPGRRFEYRYDPVGNRQTSGDTGQASLGDDEYAANAANQYDGRENNTIRFVGTAGATANVAVTGSFSVSKRDRAWSATINRAASDTARQATATVFAALPGQGQRGQRHRPVRAPGLFCAQAESVVRLRLRGQPDERQRVGLHLRRGKSAHCDADPFRGHRHRDAGGGRCEETGICVRLPRPARREGREKVERLLVRHGRFQPQIPLRRLEPGCGVRCGFHTHPRALVYVGWI